MPTTEELRRWVSALDPPRARLGRTQLLRAVEVALLTGRRVSELHAGARTRAAMARALSCRRSGAGRSRSGSRRARGAMFDAGWVDEVRALRRRVPGDAPAWNASGYGAIRELVAGDDHASARRWSEW